MTALANWNGFILPEKDIIISPNNRSFKYGEGFFETVKVINGRAPLLHLHFNRLFSSLSILQFYVPASFTRDFVSAQIFETVAKNGHQAFARVRLVIYRDDEPAGNDNLQFIIQSFPGDPSSLFFNQEGLRTAFYEAAVKSYDSFSPLKSNNYLPYSMGAAWAKKNGFDDCLLLNANGSLADATIANIFLVKDDIIKTPPIQSGCVAGVMRRFLLDNFANDAISFVEADIYKEELLTASEVFFTNANYGIRWVESLNGKTFTNATSTFLHQKYVSLLFNTTTF